MKVLIAEAPGRTGWTKFHRDFACSGLRKGELADGADYVERDLEEPPDSVKPCQFPCCFQGYDTAAALKTRVRSRSIPASVTGIRVGQAVEFRELGDSETKSWRIVRGAANPAEGELSAGSPIARGLIGREPGDVVDIALPSRVLRVEIVDVR
jgi:hypothetical protein